MSFLTAQDIKKISEREIMNAARRDTKREAWNQLAQELAAKLDKQAHAPRVEIDLGPDAKLLIRNQVVLHFGPLQFYMPCLDQVKISQALLRLQAHSHEWPDGTLRGVKRLLRKNGKWVSPTQGTVWEGDSLSATDFDETSNLRGEAGIHAVWVDKLDELQYYKGHLVELKGWGQVTVGDLGWRAQHAYVVRELL